MKELSSELIDLGERTLSLAARERRYGRIEGACWLLAAIVVVGTVFFFWR